MPELHLFKDDHTQAFSSLWEKLFQYGGNRWYWERVSCYMWMVKQTEMTGWRWELWTTEDTKPKS